MSDNDNTKEHAVKVKCQKDYPEFADAQNGLAKESLEKNLLTYAKYREETEMAKKKDEALQNAKDAVSELAAPYNDALKALKLKTAYLNVLLEEKGHG